MYKNPKKFPSILFKIGLLAISILMVVSCAPAATPTTAPAVAPVVTEAPTDVQSTEPIIFGMVAPMTGDAAEYGTQLERGVQLAVDEINAAGGINGRTVELDICDDKCDPYEASLCAQKMTANEKIFAVIGHVCSSCTLAAGPIYDKAGLTDMTVSSTNPEVTKKGWTHVFRTVANDGMQGPLIADLAVNKLGNSKVAIIYANNDYGVGLKDATQPAIIALGAQVVAVETFAPGVDKDFSAQLTKIAQAEPDTLVLLTDYSEGGLIVKQRIAAGLGDIDVIASGGNSHQSFIDLGGAGAEGVYFLNYFDADNPDPLVQEFVTKYVALYNEKPATEIAPYGYEAPYIYKMAIEKGATKETLPEVMHTIKYTGVTGTTEFGADGDVLNKGQFVLIVKDGKFTSYVP
ncbi:MAG: ABC transporter substrate-binding protein [Anaerolineales bacterium]|nr:ABC transporter substrate-binding protein [Anaerolineales bacterium]